MSTSIQAAKILADSFLNYPLMRFALEGCTEAQCGKKLNQIYRGCSSAAAMFGGVIVTPDQEGALIWLPGKFFPLTLSHEIKSGMGGIPFRIGIKATLRLMRHEAAAEKWIRNHAGDHFGYIWSVGVNNASRGKGYGRGLIDESIEQMRRQGMNEFWLKTEDPKNVAIYQKLGFELIYEKIVKSSGVTSWMMRRR